MKKLLTLLLAFVMMLSLAACKKETGNPETTTTTVSTEKPTVGGNQEPPTESVPPETQAPEEDTEATIPVDAPDSTADIEQAQLDFQQAQGIQIAQTQGVENVLLIGSDCRNATENGRADTIIMLTLNYNTKTIHQTSFMRAMYVCIPRAEGNTWGMLNAAYSWGGPQLLMDTIALNFRVKIDHYMVIDFDTYEKAIDLVGGVELELSEEEAKYIFSDDASKAHAGHATLNGKQALDYSRMRQIDNDFKRTQRQRKVIDCLIAKLGNADFFTLMKLTSQILPMIGTDFKNSEELLGYILNAMPSMENATQGIMIPVENQSGETYTGLIYVNGQEMYKVDFTANIEILHDYISS